jgi:hypothetical protein
MKCSITLQTLAFLFFPQESSVFHSIPHDENYI